MAHVLRDRRFIFTTLAMATSLGLLAIAGPAWFGAGLAAAAGAEILRTLRTGRAALARTRD